MKFDFQTFLTNQRISFKHELQQNLEIFPDCSQLRVHVFCLWTVCIQGQDSLSLIVSHSVYSMPGKESWDMVFISCSLWVETCIMRCLLFI